MGIGEGERRVLRQRDPLRGRSREGAGRGRRAAARRRADRGEVHMRAQEGGIARDGGLEVGVLHRLDQPQVPLGQREIAPARQRAQHRHARALHPQPRQAFVPGARHAVQDHARHRHAGIVGGETQRRGRRRLRLPAHVDHQHHGPAHRAGRLGARPPARLAARGHPVEQAHGPLGQAQVRPPRLRRERPEKACVHRPGVEVERRAPAAARWKAGSM
jgi:hypothetical protein